MLRLLVGDQKQMDRHEILMYVVNSVIFAVALELGELKGQMKLPKLHRCIIVQHVPIIIQIQRSVTNFTSDALHTF